MDESAQRREAARQWLTEAAAAENQQFLTELAYYRTGRSPSPPEAGNVQPQAQPVARVSPEALTDARSENADFQQHVANYDPNLFRRGRRRKVEYDKPVGARPATVQDAAAADQAFLESLRNWSPN